MKKSKPSTTIRRWGIQVCNNMDSRDDYSIVVKGKTYTDAFAKAKTQIDFNRYSIGSVYELKPKERL